MAKTPNPKLNETKSSNNNKGKKKKKNKISGPNAVAMKQKASQKANPFETIWSRSKFDILGKKRKGEERRIGLARSAAIEKRKNTLLKEYEQSGKSSVFIDKRIGERNVALGEFDKAILRSQRERQLKLSKKNKYNLSDGEEDDLDFQGTGPFSERDDFEEELLSEDDDDAGGAEKESAVLKQLNSQNTVNPFAKGLMDGEEHKQKSKKEVMDEIILKSKYFKAQKAKDKEENDQLMEKLDNDFTSLVQSEALVSLTQPSKMNALKALVNKNVPIEYIKKDELSVSQSTESTKQEQPDSYDKLLKEMGLEMRARPSERTKTPEEIAHEERERLERLEEERQTRMTAADDSSDEESEAHKDVKATTQKLRSVSGDDLGDSFSLDEEQGTKKGWVDEVLERRDAEDLKNEDSGPDGDSEGDDDDDDDEDDNDNDEGSGKDNKKIENALSLKDWEQSDDDNLDTDLEGDEEEEEEDEDDDDDDEMEPGHKAVEIKKRTVDSLNAQEVEVNGKRSSVRPDSIPFVIEAPSSLEELSMLLENRSSEDIIAAIHRIRVCNATSLKAENRKKMQVFYGVLLQYFAVLANKKPLNLKLLNLLVKPLMDMSAEIPYFAAICARQRILRTRMQLCEAIKNLDKSCWPSMKTLSLLRLWSMIFPCSDFRHVVMTPAILLMCEYLMRCPIMCVRDIAVGSFLCSMVLSVTKQSRKFCPEAIMFIQTLLMAAANRKQVSCQESQFYYPMELNTVRSMLCIRGSVKGISPLDFLAIMDMPEETSFLSSDDFRASVLVSVIETLRGLADIYERLNSYPDLFLPISKLLLEVADQENMPNAIQDKLKDVSQLIMKNTNDHHRLRRPLQMRKQKPVPIKLLNPKFEENFVKGRDYDPDRERAERRKLKKLVKKEAKGAIRELRKDNYFLFEAKQRDKALQEEERAEKYGKARAFLQEQEHAFKSGQLGKGKKRRR